MRRERFRVEFREVIVRRSRSTTTLLRLHALKIGFFAAALTGLSAVVLLAVGLTGAAGVVATLVPVVFGGFAVLPKVWPLQDSPSAPHGTPRDDHSSHPPQGG